MKELTATLTAPEWDLVANALGQRPYVEVANILSKLGGQLQSQNQQPAPPVPKQDQGET